MAAVLSLSLLVFISLFCVLTKNDARIKNTYTSFVADINIMKLVETDSAVINAQGNPSIA